MQIEFLVPASRHRVAIVEDHPLFRAGLKSVLDRDDRFEVVCEVGAGQAALAQLESTSVDVAVIDVMLPDTTGAALTAALKQRQPRCKVLGLSFLEEPARVAEMLSAGACGFALKMQTGDEILDAAHKVANGEHYLAPSLPRDQIEALLRDPSAWPLNRLTGREREVFQLLVCGCNNDDIASRLFIARRTVETHRHHVMHKLQARSLVDLVRMAQRYGIPGV